METNGGTEVAYILEGTINLVDWKPICMVRPDEEGNCCYEDAVADEHPSRFYRIRQR